MDIRRGAVFIVRIPKNAVLIGVYVSISMIFCRYSLGPAG